MSCKTALITGITGQDGSYLAELLLSMDYAIHGLQRHINKNASLYLYYGDLTDIANPTRIICKTETNKLNRCDKQQRAHLRQCIYYILNIFR